MSSTTASSLLPASHPPSLHHYSLILLHASSREVPLPATRRLCLLHHQHLFTLHHHTTHNVAHVVSQSNVCREKAPAAITTGHKGRWEELFWTRSGVQLPSSLPSSPCSLISFDLGSGVSGLAVGSLAAMALTSSISTLTHYAIRTYVRAHIGAITSLEPLLLFVAIQSQSSPGSLNGHCTLYTVQKHWAHVYTKIARELCHNSVHCTPQCSPAVLGLHLCTL